MKKKLSNNLEKFKASIKSLKEALKLPVIHDRDRAGIIQTFEFTYELSWKTLKVFLEIEGHETTTARDSFKKAYALKIIDNEDLWISMIDDRNLTTHTYNKELANEVIKKIKEYVILFDKLYKIMNKKG